MPSPTIVHAVPGPDALARAIAMLPEDPAVPAVIRLAPGVYEEKVELCRANTTLEGHTAEDTIIRWGDGAREILEDGKKRGTFRTATLRTDGDRITLRRLTIENTASPREKAGQALALYADGDLFLCEDVTLTSFQDTLFTAPLPPKEVEKDGFKGPKQFAPRVPQRHLYRRCRISGDIDFIFGGADALFEECDIIAHDGREDRAEPFVAYCTAGSTPEGRPCGYVFHRCRFLNGGCPPRSVYLARPWREYAKAAFIDCWLGEHIRTEGFHDWGKPAFHELGCFAEYGSTGPGAEGERAPYAKRLTKEEADALLAEIRAMTDPIDTVRRREWRAALRAGIDEAALTAAVGRVRASAERAREEGSLCALCVYRWQSMVFVYCESVTDAPIELSLLEPLRPFLQLWPEEDGPVPFAPMYPIYWHHLPEGPRDWLKDRHAGKTRIGRIAFVKPEKLFSYTYWHQAIVREGVFKGDKYQFISLHENILFSYFEEPRLNVNITGSEEPSKVIEGWLAVDPESHFDREKAGGENFRVIPPLLIV